jgi:L-fuconolactonase
LSYDALVNPKNLAALRNRLIRTPGLRVCIDHLAYPDPNWTEGGTDERAWKDHLAAFAAEGCVIKLSGFGHKFEGQWQPDRFRRFVDAVLTIFGPSKVIWASNWPTVLTECSFSDWYDACRAWTSALSPTEQGEVFGGNARRFYRLDASEI